MKLFKLTALSLLLFGFTVGITSCVKNDETKKVTNYQKGGIPLTSAQEYNPANTSSAIGSLNVFYSKETKILTYSFNWSGLTGPVTVFHIHGLGPTGYAAPVVQTLATASIVRCPTFLTTVCGSYSGTLLVDGVVVKEEDLLNGNYYVNIHTATYPGGEIRGQIIFQ